MLKLLTISSAIVAGAAIRCGPRHTEFGAESMNKIIIFIQIFNYCFSKMNYKRIFVFSSIFKI